MDALNTIYLLDNLESHRLFNPFGAPQLTRFLQTTWTSASHHISFRLSSVNSLHCPITVLLTFLVIFPPQLYPARWCLLWFPSCLLLIAYAKMLGVTISNNLTWSKHVDNIVSKAGKRVYMLYQLKRAGISQNDLLKIYVSIIRPVLEYACPIWSTSLPKYVSDAIEMIQKPVLRSIHPGLHYDDILVLISLQSLTMRRDNICKAYFNRLKCNTHRLNHLIPERRDVHYSLRNANVYPIPVTRTDRYKNSIVPWGLCNWQ